MSIGVDVDRMCYYALGTSEIVARRRESLRPCHPLAPPPRCPKTGRYPCLSINIHIKQLIGVVLVRLG